MTFADMIAAQTSKQRRCDDQLIRERFAAEAQAEAAREERA